MGQIHAFCALSTSIEAETGGLNSFNFQHTHKTTLEPVLLKLALISQSKTYIKIYKLVCHLAALENVNSVSAKLQPAAVCNSEPAPKIGSNCSAAWSMLSNSFAGHLARFSMSSTLEPPKPVADFGWRLWAFHFFSMHDKCIIEETGQCIDRTN